MTVHGRSSMSTISTAVKSRHDAQSAMIEDLSIGNKIMESIYHFSRKKAI